MTYLTGSASSGITEIQQQQWRLKMTMTLNPARDEVQAAFLKAHLKMVKIGMLPAKGMTKTKLLAKAGGITGVKYKRGQYDAAIADLQVIVDEAIQCK